MRENFSKKKEDILNNLDMPKEFVYNVPKITIIGDREVIIENHKGIERFESNSIKIKTSKGVLEIEGECFEILYIASETIIVSGKFKGINYGGGKDEI